jgi:hypothetical protein
MFAADGCPVLEIQDLGDSEKLLQNQHYFKDVAQRQPKLGIPAIEGGCSGWLGRCQAALVRAAVEFEVNRGREVDTTAQDRSHDRE